jgi:ATPase subunit of ABC transporter with duplicated ATPase domains
LQSQKITIHYLSVQGLGLHHSGNYLFRDVNFTIKKDDKIGLVGKNGAGKSTLLKMISGDINFTKEILFQMEILPLVS